MTCWANRYGPWALVTGAAMGLGQAYAEALAARGLSLLLVDVAEPELAATADRLARRTTVRTAAIDLGASSAADALDDACDGLDLGLAVHCAAVCPIGSFLAADRATHQRTVDVNVGGTLAVAHVTARRLAHRRRGGGACDDCLTARETTDRFCIFVTWTLTLISRTYMTSRASTDTSKIRPISRINLFEAAEFRVPPRRDVRIVARLFYAVP